MWFVDADYFIKELAKIDLMQMKKYNLERFFIRRQSQGYRHMCMTILAAFIEKKKTLKTTIGTIYGNLDQTENILKAFEAKQASQSIDQRDFEDKMVLSLLTQP